MVLSKFINIAIEENYETIIDVVPFPNILMRLRSNDILTSDQYDNLRKNDNREDLGFDCIEILKSKKDDDFFQFCKILKDSQIQNVQDFGQFLEDEAIAKRHSHGKSNDYNIIIRNSKKHFRVIELNASWTQIYG